MRFHHRVPGAVGVHLGRLLLRRQAGFAFGHDIFLAGLFQQFGDRLAVVGELIGGNLADHAPHRGGFHAFAEQMLADLARDAGAGNRGFLGRAAVEGHHIGKFAHLDEMVLRTLGVAEGFFEQRMNQQRHARPPVADLLLDRFQLQNMQLGGGQGGVGRRFFVQRFYVGAHPRSDFRRAAGATLRVRI